jgi:SpoVK/Ycf46/Vps4 family AAA+-type ATPase
MSTTHSTCHCSVPKIQKNEKKMRRPRGTSTTMNDGGKQLSRYGHSQIIMVKYTKLLVLLHILNLSSSFSVHPGARYSLALSSDATGATSGGPSVNFSDLEKNRSYIDGLLENLSNLLDKWIVTGAESVQTRAYNIIKQIERESLDQDQVQRSIRMATRAGMPLDDPAEIKMAQKSRSSSSGSERKSEAEQRKEWENQFQAKASGEKKPFVGNIAGSKGGGRSALSNRMKDNSKPDLFMDSVVTNRNPQEVKEFADGKKALQQELSNDGNAPKTTQSNIPQDEAALAQAKTSEIVAKAGSGSAFNGSTLGIGGLDDVLSQVKRRVWVPLAAPPSLLKELGINPVRGLLLYGLPGCGKTLLARSLGHILSPVRPITVVSGPEIMDKFVGSSEANLREIFDNPPEIYDNFRIGTKDNGSALEKAALHVIILDEFDAIARSRGGSGKGDQGDAGVARDSVVNQLLAKLDGVDPLVVPTLVIGLTNRRTLIEPALLRPGRFEVQIEVPKPKTVAQRVSILKVHTSLMFKSGRLYVRDAPSGTTASKRCMKNLDNQIMSYAELLNKIAVTCDGMSGASLAGVCRAAASRALERAVFDFAGHIGERNEEEADGYSIEDCLVTEQDFDAAIEDVLESSKSGDGGEDENESVEMKTEP